MALPRWSPEMSSVIPTLVLVDPSDAPSEKEDLLWLIVELCKRLGKDQPLNQLICQKLRTVKDKEMKKIFKSVSSIQFQYPGQEKMTSAPKANVSTYYLYHPSVPLYEFVGTNIWLRSGKLTYFHYFGAPASTSDLRVGGNTDLSSVWTTSYPSPYAFSVSFRQPGTRLCVLLLAELRGENTACRFIPLFVDLTAAQQSSLPTVLTAASSLDSLSAASSSSSTTGDLPPRKKSHLVTLYATVRVPTLPILSIRFGPQNNPFDDIDRHQLIHYGTIQLTVKTFELAAVNPTLSSNWPRDIFEEFEFCLTHQHPSLAPMVGASAEGSLPALFFVNSGVVYQILLLYNKASKMGRVLFEEIFDALLVAADGLAFLHSHNRVHGRFWPGCIGRDSDGNIRIFDYSCKTRTPLDIPDDDSPARAHFIYQAPESACLEEMNAACDVYSFGVFLWSMFHRTHPMPFKNCEVRAGVVFPIDDNLSFRSIGLEPLFRRCIEATEPAKRPSMSEIASELFQLSLAYRLKQGWTDQPPEILYGKVISANVVQRVWCLGNSAVRY